jgi:hypothetical protein
MRQEMLQELLSPPPGEVSYVEDCDRHGCYQMLSVRLVEREAQDPVLDYLDTG